MLKVDLHLHTNCSGDSRATPQSIVDRCIATGINCIAVTDHNTTEGALAVRSLAPFDVIVGSEIKSSAGDIIGLFLTNDVPKNLTPVETVQAIQNQGALVMVPHPFDRIRSSAIGQAAFEEIAGYVDIIETFNARNIFKRDDDNALQIAQKHHLLVAVVSDAHTSLEIGSTYLEMAPYDGTPEDFKQSLASTTLSTKRTKFIHRLAPTYAKLGRLLRI